MNYKKIIKSQKLRIKILHALGFVPDKQMVKLQYYIKNGRKLNLKNPQRYTEKLQWYKLFYHDERMSQCVEKYNVRSYIKQIGCENLLNECYGVYDSPEMIDFSALPKQFVIKDTIGAGSLEVAIVRDKESVDYEKLMAQLKSWVKRKSSAKNSGREWPYDNQKHRIIVEKYLEASDGDLPDYKFFCFHGKVKYLEVRFGYTNDHDGGKVAMFDENLNWLQGVGWDYCGIASEEPELPSNIRQMIEYAEKLSKEFPHVRVDLYNVNGKIIFGELTFYHASGYFKFEPDEFDYKIGDAFTLPRLK